jgi:hypothetical protein
MALIQEKQRKFEHWHNATDDWSYQSRTPLRIGSCSTPRPTAFSVQQHVNHHGKLIHFSGAQETHLCRVESETEKPFIHHVHLLACNVRHISLQRRAPGQPSIPFRRLLSSPWYLLGARAD